MSRLLSVVLACLGFVHAAAGQTAAFGEAGPFAGTEHVSAVLSADLGAAVPGEGFRLGLGQTIDEGWHTYWRNPGDSGAATQLTWTLPEGVEAGPVQWPLPEAIPYFDLMNYGYEDEAFFVTDFMLASDWPAGKPVEIGLRADWLVCSDICIPESVDLALTLPTASGPPRAHPINGHAFDEAEATFPRASPFRASLAGADDETFLLAIDGLPPSSRVDDAYFFAGSPGIVRHAAEQVVSVENGRLVLAIEREPAGEPGPSLAGPSLASPLLKGVLVLQEDAGDGPIRQGFLLSAGIDPASAMSVPSTPRASEGLWQAVLFAFLGGLILNLMPCVFPVLSMKALSLMRHAGEPGAVTQGLVYTAGVLLSFLGLATALIAMKRAGAAVGWGFQLQSPPVIALLACLMLVVGLWLAGAIRLAGETGERLQAGLMNTGSGLARRSGTAGSFFTGVLAVLVATPCTAPFMAPALGFALTRNTTTALAVFAALGIGFAMPFLLLSVLPGIGRLLPRPGPWMERFREVLAFPMYATAAWLLWVLSRQTGPDGLLSTLLAAVLIAFALWLLRFSAIPARFLTAGAFAAALALIVLQGGSRNVTTTSGGQSTLIDEAGPAEPFSQVRLDELLGEGRPVFVNMTAAWCITCLVNERTALSSTAFQDALEDADIAYLKGDWTSADPEITAFLERFDRSGVPVYVFYPGRSGKPRLLPQILTESTVLEAFAEAR